MSNISKYKNGWFLILFILIGIVAMSDVIVIIFIERELVQLPVQFEIFATVRLFPYP